MTTCAKCGGKLYDPGEVILTEHPGPVIEGIGHLPSCPDGLICQHGSLRRSCEICDRDAEIAQLREAVRLLLSAHANVYKLAFGEQANPDDDPARRKATALLDGGK
jgi:hypothetical protein